MAGRTSQEGVIPLGTGTPSARTTQEGFIVAGVAPSTVFEGRTTQEGVIIAGTAPPAAFHARTTQVAVIFLYLPGISGSDTDSEEFFYPVRPQVSR